MLKAKIVHEAFFIDFEWICPQFAPHVGVSKSYSKRFFAVCFPTCFLKLLQTLLGSMLDSILAPFWFPKSMKKILRWMFSKICFFVSFFLFFAECPSASSLLNNISRQDNFRCVPIYRNECFAAEGLHFLTLWHLPFCNDFLSIKISKRWLLLLLEKTRPSFQKIL